MSKFKVYTDGNGSSDVLIVGMGHYIPKPVNNGWISIDDVELELHANYWVKTIDGSVLREVALYDGSSFTNGRWPVAISLISEVIKLTPPAAE